MADPISAGLGGLGLAATALGAGTQAAGAAYTGAAQAAQYKYQGGLARVNAQLAQQDAAYAEATGRTEQVQSGLETKAQIAATGVGITAGNISLGSASARNVLASETAIGQYKQAQIGASAAKRAYGFEVTSAQDIAQAGAYDVSAQTAKTAAQFGVASSFIGGVASVSSKFLQGQQQGLWS